LWTYNGSFIGPQFEVRTGQPITVMWENELPDRHFLPIDHTIHGAESSMPEVRTVVHLHGAKVLADSDGHPDAWFTNSFAKTGPRFSTRVYHYPNDQAAMHLWYHDHAVGITRLNFHTGLVGLYFVRDEVDDALPIPKGKYEMPLVLMDRLFNADGSFDYPMQDPGVSPPIPPVWIPEFFGDTGLVNGKVMPFLKVEPRKYRFRMLNACNARFLHLTLATADGKTSLPFFQIGADQGFLPHAVELNDMLMGPAERNDVVIDFARQQGKSFILMNDAPAPFPGGGAPDVPQFMVFRVTLPLTGPDEPLPRDLAPVDLINPREAVRVRQLALRENDDPTTGDPIIATIGDRRWSDPVDTNPKVNTTEMWELINTTTDGHPIHVHLVRFQVLNRQLFDLNIYNETGNLQFVAPPELAAPNERPAWKDVVKVFPGDAGAARPTGNLTRIIQKFELPNGAEFPRGTFQQYVWHCHILEHEDNEMMRPYNVVS